VKELVILGGPNGAGKTTAAQDLLPKTLGIREFVNADEIARGLSPFNPDATAVAAGRLMIERIRALAAAGEELRFRDDLCRPRSCRAAAALPVCRLSRDTRVPLAAVAASGLGKGRAARPAGRPCDPRRGRPPALSCGSPQFAAALLAGSRRSIHL